MLELQGRLEAVMSRLEGLEVGVEGLELPELPNPLPRPSPLLTQWAWRPTTCRLPPAEEAGPDHPWLQDSAPAAASSELDTGELPSF